MGHCPLRGLGIMSNELDAKTLQSGVDELQIVVDRAEDTLRRAVIKESNAIKSQ